MSVNLSEQKRFSIIGMMWEFILRLLKLMNADQLENGFKQVINDPVRRRSVADALTGQLVSSTPMTKQEWIDRWTNLMDELGIIDQAEVIRKVAEVRFGADIQFVPEGLTREQLFELARKMGIKINSDPHYNGEELPTVAGTLECNLAGIMQPADSSHRPFNLNCDEHKSWAKEQGGDGLTSAEEVLWLLILAYKQFGKVSFMGGWIRCRNSHSGAGGSLVVGFSAGNGLSVSWGHRSSQAWGSGAVARKFMPLVS